MAGNYTLGEFGEGGDDDGPAPIDPVQRWSPEPTPCPRCGGDTQALWLTTGYTGRCEGCTEW